MAFILISRFSKNQAYLNFHIASVIACNNRYEFCTSLGLPVTDVTLLPSPKVMAAVVSITLYVPVFELTL